jgi:DNA-binding MarR family transcriptional regulator
MANEPESYELLFSLLKVKNSLDRSSEAFFQPFGLTASKFNILNVLSLNQGRMDQSELVDQLLVGKSSTSIVLNRMLRDHLIKREPHPTDKRQAVLVITEKGSRLWSQVSPTYEKNVSEAFGVIPPSHRKQFLADLDRLQEALASPAKFWPKSRYRHQSCS